MVTINSAASVAIMAVGIVAAAFVGFGLARPVPVGKAQFEIQVEEGIGTFDRLPVKWAALHLR